MKSLPVIETCQRCILACEECLAAEIRTGSANRCPACCRECIALCALTLRSSLNDSPFAGRICALCADVCDDCARQCWPHNHDHCQRCTDACTACARICRPAA
jgi:hypothetical protein